MTSSSRVNQKSPADAPASTASLPTGAVICAAGLSSRMRNFKPMLHIGSHSMIIRIITSFQAAGVSPIVVVTGYKAAALRQHLSGTGVILVHNEHYASTHMYDSLLLGLSALETQVSRFFFVPADIPLFHSRSLKLLMETHMEMAVIPTFHGKSGHPVLISSACIPYLKQYDGQNGLRGAWNSLPTPPVRIEVEDEGILLDADNDNDYYRLLKKERALSGEGILHFDLDLPLLVTEPCFSRSSALLLELIEQTGSIQTASDCMHISYTTAWKTVNHLEQQLGYSVIQRMSGGLDGGGSCLTAQGRRLLDAYQRFYSRMQAAGEQAFQECFHGIMATTKKT